MAARADDFLREMREYLRPSPSWEEWLRRPGVTPTDPDTLPSIPDLPEPLNFQGHRVSSRAEWAGQRARILGEFKRYVIGTYPEPPGNISAEIVAERSEPGGAIAREIRLSFGPGRRATLFFELLVPPGPGPFPVFMTQRNHRGWCRIALMRGYAAVAYHGSDGFDDTEKFAEVWPEHDWSSLCRRAWGAGRVLDWLHTQSYIDPRHACITGHSRNGKLSLVCGAIDERFTAVISSSSGIGGAAAYRYANEAQFSEGIEPLSFLVNAWFHLRIRAFSGREDRLPVDANLLLALSAPRAVLVSSAINDHCDSVKACEAAVRSAADAYGLFEARDRLRIYWRAGEHESRARDIEAYLDWCDLHFGRATGEASASLRAGFPEKWHFTYTFEKWRMLSGEAIDPQAFPVGRPLEGAAFDPRVWDSGRTDREKRIGFLLGEAPTNATRINGADETEPIYTQRMLFRPQAERDQIQRLEFNFGEDVPGTLYAPQGSMANDGGVLPAKGKVPVFLWMPPEVIASGYSGSWLSEYCMMPLPMLKEGMAVACFDPIGSGTRLEEVTRFYDRYPRWSLLGKLVHDARRAIDALHQIPVVDTSRIFLVGFGMGGTAALIAGALDARVAGVASVCGFTPWRGDTPDRPTGGLARHALWPGGGLLPRLGFFARTAEDARRVPIDFDEIIAAIAPRKLICITPTRDREVNHADVSATMTTIGQIYQTMGAPENFSWESPIDHRRFGPQIQKRLFALLNEAAR